MAVATEQGSVAADTRGEGGVAEIRYGAAVDGWSGHSCDRRDRCEQSEPAQAGGVVSEDGEADMCAESVS